ncbi:DUF998 domain-containing protein [Pseudonocardia humida]|uniref:DUF998 domain-containing protein n=1 Tax=Pseudonocardia humida TaxID=2800819 RepID=A0ABT1A911_9PSEU|nr:DUF998 domain-containing protein [Pseudonocardia humida]MCO1659521.1 DUF998 domain-containing protein [Pseudonocardia humida]
MGTAPAPDDRRTRQAALRRAIGVIGVGLPVVLPLGEVLFFRAGLPATISGFYYTDMRNVLVGAMCAVGVYLLYYPGYDRGDNLTSAVAGLGAITLALSPTTPPARAPTTAEAVAGVVHYVGAGAFFLALAYLSYFRFTRTAGAPTAQKLRRNVLYRVCGIVMVVAIALAVLLDNVLPEAVSGAVLPVFWLEVAAVLAFGLSWLVKGEALLQDR